MKLFSGPPLSLFADPATKRAATGGAARPAPERPAAPVERAAPPVAVQQRAEPPGERQPPAARRPKPALRPGAAAAVPDRTLPVRHRVVSIPRLAQGGRWRVEAMRSLSEPLLLWFTRGQGRITVGGITRGYGTHNAVFIPAGVMHGFEVGAQTYGTAVFFGQDSGVDLPADPLHLRVRETQAQSEITTIIDAAQRELESQRPGSDRAARHHFGLIGVWIERQLAAAVAEAKRPLAAQRLARAYADLLEREFRSGQGVGDYARTLGVTPTHLSRVCNQCCGRSASDLLHDRLIFEARRLLAETKVPIGAISAELGFTSPAYFTRAFQHRTGKTPSAFRRQG